MILPHSEVRYEQVNGNTFVIGDNNGDAHAEFMFALIGEHVLVASDFIL